MKTIIKKYQIVGSYSFSEVEGDDSIQGYDTYEEAVAAASLNAFRDSTYVVEIKSTVKRIVKPVDVTVEEFQ